MKNPNIQKFGEINRAVSRFDHARIARTKRYRITNRVTNQTYEARAFTADEACRKLGWLIGDCYILEMKEVK